MSDFSNYRPSLECYGVAQSPLNAYRYTGHHIGVKDNNATPPELSIKQKEQVAFYAKDIAGNNVPVSVEFLPTLTKKLSLTEKQVEELKQRSPSPCPCKSKECEEEYLKDVIKFESLISKGATLPHASGIHLFRVKGE